MTLTIQLKVDGISPAKIKAIIDDIITGDVECGRIGQNIPVYSLGEEIGHFSIDR